MIFYTLAPHFFNLKGHSYHYHLAAKEALAKLGLSHRVLIRKDVELPKSDLHTIPHFGPSIWKNYLSLFRKKGKKIFFHESCTSFEFLVLFLTSFFLMRKKDSLWILLRYGRHQLPFKGLGHTLLIRLLKWRFKHRFVGLTDSELIAKEFNLHTLPIPHANFSPKESREIICWWPGPPRKEKGLEIMRRLAPHRQTLKLALSREAHIACDYPLAPELTDEEYKEWMEKSRVILLPYDSEVYKCGSSGIFVEAIVAGKIPFVTSGTWLAHELKRFSLNALIVDFKVPDFFDQVQQKLTSQEIQQKLEKMQAAYSDYHSIEQYHLEFKRFIAD